MKNLFPLLVISLLVACTSRNPQQLVPYTTSVQYDIGLGEEELKNVQFYNSDRIVLYRKAGKNATEVISGDVKVINGRHVEEIVIPRHTPGVLVSSNEGKRLGISFENGDDRYLVFGLNPTQRGVFSIYGKNWKNNSAVVDYDGKEYLLAAQSSKVILMINFLRLNALKVNSRTAEGRTIDPILTEK